MRISFKINTKTISEVEIEKPAKKKIREITDLFKENDIFFSDSCIKNNLQLLINEKEIPEKKIPKNMKDSDKVFIKLSDNFVMLEYGPMLFNFTEDEPASKVFEAINKFLDCKCSISILNNKINLQDNDLLKSNIKYDVKILHKNEFHSKKYNRKTTICMDYNSTIQDAKEQLSIVLSDDKAKILPEFIIIYNKKEKEITDSTKLLTEVQSLKKKFIYDFSKVEIPTQNKKQDTTKEKKKHSGRSKKKEKKQEEEKNKKEESNKNEPKETPPPQLTKPDDTKSSDTNETKSDKKPESSDDTQIVFIFDKIYPLRKRIPLSMTIGQVQQMISDERQIGAKMKISYETDDQKRIEIEPSKKIGEIADKMRQQFGRKYRNALYVDIEKDDTYDKLSKTLPISKPKPKVTPAANSSSENMATNLTKYYYITNSEDEVKEIELDDEATVLTMKQKIAELNDIEYLSDVKILFAGKELLNDLNLKALEIGDIKLFVYIRTQEDVLLLTAKALHFDPEEEDEDDDDDNNNVDDDDDDE